jgi:hypothetical protein
LEASQDFLILNNQFVALPQTELDHVGVLIEKSSPQSIEFSWELSAQDAELEKALSPIFIIQRKAAQTAHVGVYFLSKGLNDRILRHLTLAIDHLAFLDVECS